MKHKRRRRIIIIAAILLAIAVGLYLYFHEPEYPFTVSKQTTVVLGPLHVDGVTVNYVAALSQMLSEGITQENNAAILLIEAFGEDFLPERVRPRVYELLEMDPLPSQGDYFVRFDRYLEANLPATPRQPTTDAEEAPGRDIEESLSEAMQRLWSREKYPEVAGWLKVNDKPLQIVTLASKRPCYYVPLISTGRFPVMINALLPGLNSHREAAKALCARALLRANSGDIEGASEDLLTCHRLARLVSQGPTIIERLVGIGVEALTCKSDQMLGTSGKLSSKQLREYLAKLRQLSPLPPLSKAAGRQRFFILDMVGVAYRRYEFGEGSSIGGLLGMDYEIPNVSVDWDDAMRVINSWCDKQVTAMEKPTYLQRTAALKKFGREVAGLRKKSKFSPRKGSGWWADAIAELSKYRSWRGFYKDNPGEALVSLLFPSLFRVDQLQDKATMQMSLTQVALALGAYKADHGEYPEELDELRRDYLKEIPNDIFVNKPPRYRREGGGYLLYSVGSDMKDDGGKELDRRSGSEDIVMRAK